MSGYLTVPNEAIDVARCHDGLEGAIFLLYIHVDTLRWKPFPCADRWMQTKLGLAKRQCRILLHALREAGCLVVDSEGDENTPRIVRFLRPDRSNAEADREPNRVRTDLRTATRTAYDDGGDSIVAISPDRVPDRVPDRDFDADRTKEDNSQLPTSTPNLTPLPPVPGAKSDPEVLEVWTEARALGTLPDGTSFVSEKPRKDEAERVRARIREDGLEAAILVVDLVYLGPNPWWRERHIGPGTFFRPKHFTDLLPKARAWHAQGRPRAGPGPPASGRESGMDRQFRELREQGFFDDDSEEVTDGNQERSGPAGQTAPHHDPERATGRSGRPGHPRGGLDGRPEGPH